MLEPLVPAVETEPATPAVREPEASAEPVRAAVQAAVQAMEAPRPVFTRDYPVFGYE